jgi:hypothetical protein
MGFDAGKRWSQYWGCVVKVRFGVLLVSVLLLASLRVSIADAKGSPPPPPPSGPAAPTPLAPLAGASVTVPFALSWSAVSDPSGIIAYNWQISPSSTFAPVISQNSTSGQTQATVSGLANGTYFWRVQAVNSNFAQGAWSSSQRFSVTGANATSPGSPTLGPPKGGTAFHPMETISFSWSAVSGAASYILDAANNPNFPVATKVHFDNIPNTNYSITLGDSMPQGTWYVRVQAVSSDGIMSVPSNTVTFTLSFKAPLPPPPTLLGPADGVTVSLPVTFTWTDVPNPQMSGYTLEIADNPNFSQPLAYLNNQITGPHWTVTSLTAGTKYWRVNAMQGDSAPGVPAVTAWSATRSFVVPSTAAIGSLALSMASPFSGDSETVTVQLSGPAPAGGAVVSLTSSNQTAAPVPATFTVPAGFAFDQFRFTTGQVTTPTPVTLTGTLNGTSASITFTVQPPSLKLLSLPSSSSGGVALGAIVMLNGLAPTGGAVVSLSSNSPKASPPATATVAAGDASVSILIPTSAVTTNTVVTITATWHGTSVQAQTTLTPQQPPASLTLSPSSTTGAAGSSGTVTLASPAPNDVELPITSSNPSVAQVNNFVTVPAGSTTGGFNINTVAVPAQTTVTISVSGAGVTKTATLTVNPAGSPPQGGTGPTASALTLKPTSVTAGGTSQGTVTLSGPAPAGGAAVSLGSSNTAATVPPSVTVPAGATSAVFTVTTGSVSGATTITITASFGGTTQFAALSINPPA